MGIRNLDRLFHPRSVALVGASARPGSLGAAVLANLRDGGLRGGLHLINPRHATIDGAPCVANLSDLPAPPDLVVIAAPRDNVMEIAEDAARLGVAVCIVITPTRATARIRFACGCANWRCARACAWLGQLPRRSLAARRTRCKFRRGPPTARRSCRHFAIGRGHSLAACVRGRKTRRLLRPCVDWRYG